MLKLNRAKEEDERKERTNEAAIENKNWKKEEEERVPKQEPDYDFGNDQEEEEEKGKDLKDNRESEEETKAVLNFTNDFLSFILPFLFISDF